MKWDPGNGAGDITPGKGKQPAVAAQLEEERGKNKKLTAQLNKDFENSSIPSSKQKAGKKKKPTAVKKQGRSRADSRAIKAIPVNSTHQMLHMKYPPLLNIQITRIITKPGRSSANRRSVSY